MKSRFVEQLHALLVDRVECEEIQQDPSGVRVGWLGEADENTVYYEVTVRRITPRQYGSPNEPGD